MRQILAWIICAFFTLTLLGCGAEDPAAPPEIVTAIPTHKYTPSPEPTAPSKSITGIVIDEDGPVAGAIVRVQTTETLTQSAEDGTFVLNPDNAGEDNLLLTGWAPGYFCSGPFEASPGDQDIVVELTRHSDEDNPEYHWLPSEFHPGEGEDQGCAGCHSREGTSLAFSLPYDEWLLDAHSQSARNQRFLSMYNGTDLNGNQSPPTRMGTSRDYGSFPLPPDVSKPYYGPGYKLDFPESAGNCSTCHTPAAAVNMPYGRDPNNLTGGEAEGVPCDFCHKIWDVKLDPASNLPRINMPGVLSYEFRRPHEGHQFFAGPFDDVAPGEDTYSALQTQSAFCAPCHFGVFWDTVIYNSYGEWLASPYGDPQTGKTCQECHMPPLGGNQFATADAGGLLRDPETIFSHRMPGAMDQDLLQDALEMTLETAREDEVLQVRVHVNNDNTGHKIPTDSPLRHMLLIIQVQDENGIQLALMNGPTLPSWAGEGDPEEGYYAGLPGVGFALILQELWTEVSPSGAYWNPTRVIADTRLDPFATQESEYRFALQGKQEITIVVRLWLRRAFMEIMDQKGWDDPDMLMAEEVIISRPEE